MPTLHRCICLMFCDSSSAQFVCLSSLDSKAVTRLYGKRDFYLLFLSNFRNQES
uniref:Uncharacterized protein n=1 Tax=Anguilla anguilla TaxID=7936 RepID=A0A0E9PWZ8_ANGAN